VEGFYKVPYEQRLKRLKLTSLEKGRQRGDLIETYKILTGKERVDPNCFFMMDKKHYSTRGQELKLDTRRSRLELRKNFFSQRVVAHWNELPESVVMAETIGVDVAGHLGDAWRVPKVGPCRVGWGMGTGVPSPAD